MLLKYSNISNKYCRMLCPKMSSGISGQHLFFNQFLCSFKNVANVSTSSVNRFMEPLEWRESFLPDGTAIYSHPSVDKLISVKKFRMNPNEMLTPEQMEEIRQLRNFDPWRYNSKSLSKQYSVSPSYINLVSKEPVRKVKRDLKLLKAYNRNRPRKGSRQFKNNEKIGKKILSKKRGTKK